MCDESREERQLNHARSFDVRKFIQAGPANLHMNSSPLTLPLVAEMEHAFAMEKV